MSLLRSSSWREARFIAIDVETTGLDPKRDEVIEYAGYPIERGRIIPGDAVRGLVHPRAASAGATADIHGLRDHDLAAAPEAPEALAPLRALMPGRVPVVHAQWVERTFLRKAGCPLPKLHSLACSPPKVFCRVMDSKWAQCSVQSRYPSGVPVP